MTIVVVERAALDDGVPLLYRDGRSCVRMAYDPEQILEPEAVAFVAAGLGRPLHGITVKHLGES